MFHIFSYSYLGHYCTPNLGIQTGEVSVNHQKGSRNFGGGETLGSTPGGGHAAEHLDKFMSFLGVTG